MLKLNGKILMMMKRYGKLITRAEKRGIANVQLIRGNARIIIPRYFTTPCFERIYVLFPDPWPKPRHAHQRLLSVEFLNQLAQILNPEGDIVLATDWQPYADWVIENVARVSELQITGNPYSQDANLNPSGEPTATPTPWRTSS